MSTGKFNAYGSYIQLNTLDEKEKAENDAKPIILGTKAYKQFLCSRRDRVIVTISFLIFAIIVTVSLALGLPALDRKIYLYYHPVTYVSPSPTVFYDNATIISDGQLCAEIGKNILLQGGHAVDVAIATLFCNGVVNPESMGLGGGFIMLIYNRKTRKTEVIDAREVAPAAATVDMFVGNASNARIGGLAVAVPGELRGYWEAHAKYGRLNWTRLIEPSIKICEEGFPVSKHMADKLHLLKNVQKNQPFRDTFINNETEDLYKENEIFTRPALAKTLKLIAEKGQSALYEEPLVKVLVEDIKNCGHMGSIITEDDFKNYKVKFKDSVRVNLKNPHDRTLLTVPTPGSGPILSHIMLILDGYKIAANDYGNWSSRSLLYHRMVEALKYGFAARMNIADDEEDATISELINDLLSREFADKVREKISDVRTYEPSFYTSTLNEFQDHGTSHVAVLTPDGDAVVTTSSINSYFGSLCISPSTGIIFNNQMDDFSSPNITNYFDVAPSVANEIKPGKRPLSSMSPAIILDGEDVELIASATGGTRIISTLVQALMEMLWLDQDPKGATDAPRIHHQLIPNHISSENYFPQVYVDQLTKRGHSFQRENHASGFLSILKTDKINTNVDYRRGGSVSGF